MTTPVQAAFRWPSNAEMIEDCVRLGYLSIGMKVLDPTYGNGIWWKKWRPHDLTMHDKFSGPAKDGVDFRDPPHPPNTFDAICFDPPYVSKGGRKTTTMPDFQDRYGMEGAPKTPAGVQLLINDGMTGLYEVLKPGGLLLVKNQDYISSGKFWDGTHWTTQHAYDLGMTKVDRLEHIGTQRPQPDDLKPIEERRKQKHARRNLSTLFVFRKDRA